MLGSCAKSYYPINPAKLQFNTATVTDSLNFATRYNVLAEAGNERYAQKEVKNGVKLLAVQVFNRTSHDIVLRKDARFIIDGKIVFPIEPAQMKNQLKQHAGLYMLWGLFWGVYSQCENNDCTVVPIPIGLVIGAINTSKASKANKQLLDELEQNNILDMVIKPGESKTGLLGFGTDLNVPVKIELN